MENSLYLQKTNSPWEMTYLATRTYLANIIPGFIYDCPRCNPPETTLHAIRDCMWAKDCWIALPGQRAHNFFQLPLGSS